ncbi:MAG: hypothetical protein B1H04_00660 [Planctomycetales bacterium 4484_123]|nr:MAG: hypothetical protein B1H04_00660 [Planctomycetales bacterium 4484_123]
MKTFDRYVVKNFLISVALCFVVLMALRIVADLAVYMDEFTEKTAGGPEKSATAVLEEIGIYYGYQSLVYFRQLSGVIIVTAAAFTLAWMNHTNELTALLASGVSLHRVLLPVVIAAVLLNVLVVADSELLIPPNKDRLVRSPDNVRGKAPFQIRLVSDNHENIWYAGRYLPKEQRLLKPLILLRDDQLAYAGHLTAPQARYDPQQGWVFSADPPAGPDDVRLHLVGAPAAATAAFFPTNFGPEKILGELRKLKKNRNLRIDWKRIPVVPRVRLRAPGENLVLAGRLVFKKPGDYASGVLEDARFVFLQAGGRPAAYFKASSATFGYHRDRNVNGWFLRGGQLVYRCDLDPASLNLRQATDWVQYMSIAELNRLVKLQRVPDPEGVRLVRHTRFADFFNNIIMLLVAVPFILSRERNIKASAMLTLLMVAVVYIFIYVCRYLGLQPVLAAWMPILVFGPMAAVMLDAVKT